MSEWSMEPKAFIGTLGIEEHKTDVAFTVGLDKAGHAIIEFGRMPFNKQTSFLNVYYHKAADGRFSKFRLLGAASDGAQFECDNIVFTSLGNQSVLADGSKESDEEPLYVCTMAPQALYSLARITMPARRSDETKLPEELEGTGLPALQWRVKGFESYQDLSIACPLGVITMDGKKDMNGKDELSGMIRVGAESMPSDIDDWRQRADALCRHVHHVMSFAMCAMLSIPIREFFHKETVVIEAYSMRGQQRSEAPVFHCLDLRTIYACAVRSHFEPAFEVKNINFAIQWFVMRGDYRESKLITSMTVLENLLDSNLARDDTQILSKDEFKKLRKKLSLVVKELAPEWSGDKDGQAAYIKELNERFTELQRRSLLDKISLLAKRWGVELGGIPAEFIQEAKRARDLVVHRGQYQAKKGSTRDLHDHVVTVREVVVRFILTALQFEGSYLSYLGGYHMRTFQKTAPDLGHIAGAPASVEQGQSKPSPQ